MTARKGENLEQLYLYSLRKFDIALLLLIVGVVFYLLYYLIAKFADPEFLNKLHKITSWILLIGIILCPIFVICVILFFTYVLIFCK